ncbi:hypothetical protein E0L36_02320 [Streptomyces sp. AJS327]|uniref:hypothetical protein n=1 Tax=Streptomyces sp. AJS327 TaxID=2545265 RepID=UPI0015DD8931|nr:hypothetical protein [Streptomyces sp. AJS327]MBA0049779.1 hypothetical protein [Streptomyces sp. AJS327]
MSHQRTPSAQDGSALTDQQEAVLSALRANPGTTTVALAKTANLSRSVTAKALVVLERQQRAVRKLGRRVAGSGQTPDLWSPYTEATPSSTPVPDRDEHADNSAEEVKAGPDQRTSHNDLTEEDSVAGKPLNAECDAVSDSSDRPDTNHRDDETTTKESPLPPEPGERCTLCGTLRRPPRTGGHLRSGELHQIVLRHMETHPASEFTATGLSRAIDRSGGAIANILPKLVKSGMARQVSDSPRRFQYAGSRPIDSREG